MAEFLIGGDGGGAPLPGWHGATISVPVALPGWRVLTPAAAVYTQADIPRKSLNTLWGHVASDQPFAVTILHRGLGNVYGVADTVNSVVDPFTGLQMVSIENLRMRGDRFTITVTLLGLVAMTALTYYLELCP